jgi:integrase/recombinase XerD
MLGLRVSEARSASITDLHYDSGYELLSIMGKGHKPAQIPLPVPVLRAVHDATGDRKAGPMLLNRNGDRMTPLSAAGRLRRLTKVIGLEHPISPHSLRRTFCTAGRISGAPLRDMQYAMRHADSRTTLRYDMSRANLDRHAAHPVAATSPAWPSDNNGEQALSAVCD